MRLTRRGAAHDELAPGYSVPPIPARILALVAVYVGLVPWVAYLALAVVSTQLLGQMLTVVATAYLLTASVVALEAIAALRRRRRPPGAAPVIATEMPAVSIILVAYLPNEQGIIVDTIRHILDTLDVPAHQLQLVLAYNRPARLPVEAEIERLAAHDQRFVPLLVDGSRSKAENINAALPILTGDIVGVFDADHHPAADSARRAAGWFNIGYDVVQGRCIIRNDEESWLARLVALEFGSMYAVAHAARSLLTDLAIFGGSNGYWRADVISRVAMDPSMMTEDIDATVRCLGLGYRIVHDRSVVSTELAPESVKSWLHQRLRWAQGWYQVTRRHAGRGRAASKLRFPQRLYLTYLLEWRELYAIVAPQAFPMLLAIAVVHVAFRLEWLWDPYLTATTIVTLASGFLVATAAAVQEAAVRRVRFRVVAAYLLLAPLLALIRSMITLSAWVREAQDKREWVVTARSPRVGAASTHANNRLPDVIAGSTLHREIRRQALSE